MGEGKMTLFEGGRDEGVGESSSSVEEGPTMPMGMPMMGAPMISGMTVADNGPDISSSIGQIPQVMMAKSMSGMGQRMGDASAAARSAWHPLPGSPPIPSGPNSAPIIIRDASLDGILPYGTIPEGVAALEALTNAAGGFVSSSSTSSDAWLLERWSRVTGAPGDGGLTNAYMSLRVPIVSFESTRAAVRDAIKGTKLDGSIASESSSARDATTEYVDASSRAASSLSALAAMKELLGGAQSINDILSIQREVDTINNNLESAQAQVKALSSMATMSSLTVSLRIAEPPNPSPTPKPTPDSSWSPLKTAGAAFASLGRAGTALFDFLIFVVIFSIPTAFVVGILYVIYSRTAAARASESYFFKHATTTTPLSSLSAAVGP